uniref:BHLH domain-containing protein n=1 Tax=Oryza punctata TaxID=4537 RepID=A0A0E0KZJ3_ORYPU
MDGGSWMLKAAATAADMHGGAGDTMIRCSWSDMATMTELPHQEQEPMTTTTMMMNSQAMQQQLSQANFIYMLMDMEEPDQYATDVAPSPPSPSSSSFRSFSAATTTTSRDDNSSLMLAAAAAASCHHQTEVSSQIILPPPGQASRWSGGATAFRPYSRYLRRPGATTTTGGGGGQRAFKKAISVLSKIHTARLAQYYQIMEMAAVRASPAATGGGGDSNQQLQVQHVLSERKRREKLNESFKALRDVLPPATKKDKASVLMRAKDYVNVLKARIAELEEKNRKLAESQVNAGDGEQDDDKPDDEIEVNIGRSAAEDGIPADKCQELHLKIMLGSSSRCSAMDAVAGILQGLNEKRDVSLLATGNASSSGGRLLPRAKCSQQPAVRLQLKGVF